MSAVDLDWLNPLERQVTEGWQFFLSEGSGDQRRQRAEAFVNALRPASNMDAHAGPPAILKKCLVIAEKIIPNTALRLDLYLRCSHQEADETAAIIHVLVEAKFGHVLDNDLGRYETLVGQTEQRTECYVLASKRDNALRWPQNTNWTFVGWRSFLLAYHRELAPQFDSRGFQSFRRGVFLKASMHE